MNVGVSGSSCGHREVRLTVIEDEDRENAQSFFFTCLEETFFCILLSSLTTSEGLTLVWAFTVS